MIKITQKQLIILKNHINQFGEIYRVFQKELYKARILLPWTFFLWGFVKDQVFIPPLPANVVELRTRITAAVAKVTPEMLRSVWQETALQGPDLTPMDFFLMGIR